MQQTQVSYIKIGFSKVKVKVNAKLKVLWAGDQVINFQQVRYLKTLLSYNRLTATVTLKYFTQ